MTGSFDTRLADLISDTQPSSQSEGLNEAFGQSEDSEDYCLGMEAFKICNLRLDPRKETPISLSWHNFLSASHSLRYPLSMGKKALNDMKSPLLEWLPASKCWSDQPGTQRGDGGEPSPERIS